MAGTLALAAGDHGAAVAWVAPYYGNTRALWRFGEQYAARTPLAQTLKAERRIEFDSGGSVGIYTADNDVSLRGEAFDLVICDEAAQMREETISDVIMPTLADRNGRLMAISTPKGRNWFWRAWANGRADGRLSAAWTAPTSDNPLPNIQHAFELARRRTSARTFQQEWLAEFVEDGGVFRGVRQAATLKRQTGPIQGHTYIIGIDWGRVNDASVFCVLDLTAKEQADMDRMTETAYSLQLARLSALWERWGRPGIVAELNSIGSPLVERLQQDGLPVSGVTTTATSKGQMIEAVSVAIENGDLRLLDDENQTLELEAYEATRSATGHVRYGAPAGMHDDTVMALAIAYTEHDTGPLIYGWDG